jgi:hypothetical protein
MTERIKNMGEDAKSHGINPALGGRAVRIMARNVRGLTWLGVVTDGAIEETPSRARSPSAEEEIDGS